MTVYVVRRTRDSHSEWCRLKGKGRHVQWMKTLKSAYHFPNYDLAARRATLEAVKGNGYTLWVDSTSSTWIRG